MRRYCDKSTAYFWKRWTGTARALAVLTVTAAAFAIPQAGWAGDRPAWSGLETGWAGPGTAAPPSSGQTQQSGNTGPIYSKIKGECLDHYYGHYYGHKLVAGIHHCTGKSRQRWTLPPDNTIRIAGKCLDAIRKKNGSRVVLATCNKSGGQFWETSGIVRVPGVELINPRSGKCLEDPNGSTTDGTVVQIRTCHRSAAQVWYPPPTKP
jgi:hypothetical protein